MNSSKEMTSLLSRFAELRTVLDDLNVKFVTIASNGHWSFEKLGRTRHGSEALDREVLRQVAEMIPTGRHVRSGEWALRKYEGVSGSAILIERLPVAIADRLPQRVLTALKRQVKQDGGGILVGEPGAGKGALLLWLALQIPDEPVLYVAENPPREFPGTHIMHVFPPSSRAERRALERFVRLSPTVMWDRIASSQDLMTLFGISDARRRWFTLDAPDARGALRFFAGARAIGCDLRFSTLLTLASSVIGRPEARNLAVRSADGWEEPYASGSPSCLPLLETWDAATVWPTASLAPTPVTAVSADASAFDEPEPEPVAEPEPERVAEPEPEPEIAASEPEIAAPEPEPVAEPEPERTAKPRAAAAEPAAAEFEPLDFGSMDLESYEETAEPTLKGAKNPLDNPHTIPIELTEASETSEADDDDDAITGMLANDEIEELREQAGDEIPQFQVASRSKLGVPEVTRQYDTDGSAPSYLDRVVPDFDEEPPPGTPAINLDDLRITSIEEVDEADLEVIEDIDELVEDYSGVFDGDLDFDSLAEEMLSEISEVETEVGGSQHYGGVAATNPEQRVVLSEKDLQRIDSAPRYDPDDDNRTMAATADIRRIAEQMAESSEDPEDSTKEFTLNERLLMLRRRQQDD